MLLLLDLELSDYKDLFCSDNKEVPELLSGGGVS